MDGHMARMALLLVGSLNLVLLGAVACGDKAAPAPASSDLTTRVIRLEAWRHAQEVISGDHHSVLASQQVLNRSFESYMRTAGDHAVSVDKSLTQQAEAMRLLNQVLQDVLAKLK